MNKAITEGLQLMPPAYKAGLDVWSSEDGTPGSATYDGAPNATLVTADLDFGDCLELIKTQSLQKLRYMGQTPYQPGCYLRVRARVKAVSGNLPTVRIAAWAGDTGNAHVSGLVETGPEIALVTYGDVVEVSAIIGAGNRGGVDMVWGTQPSYAHVGLDLTGPTGGVVRVDELIVEDVTRIYHRQLMDWVDVRDYGAVGDGLSDDRPAFEAADLAAAGREVLVPAGVFSLGDHMTFENPVRFVGTVSMAGDKRLTLTRNFDLPSYAEAFGDELEGFRRAVAAMFNFSDHEGLDLMGRRIDVDAPIDMQAVVGNKTTFSQRRVIRNGQFNATNSANWDPVVVSSQGTYSTGSPLQMTNVANVANIEVGSLVQGLGVGREVYVRAKNVGAQTLTLSQPLFDAAGTQTYTFTRFKYILDFKGFDALSRFVLADVELNCDGQASGVMLPDDGVIFQMRDCFITKPRDRGITSSGLGCQGLLIDRCQFLSNEQSLRAQDRTSIALNVNANDTKIRDNRVVRFAHFAVLAGSGHMITANHWFQGDSETDGIRQAGLVLTNTNVKSTLTANYVDNSFVEWSNEHDEAPEQNSEFSFGGLTVTGNIFTVNNVAPWFRWFVVKPVGEDHFINGLNISGNVFKSLNGSVERIDHVDTTYATLDMARTRNVVIEGNTFNAVDQEVSNPVTLKFDINSPQTSWTCDFGGYLPFGGRLRTVSGLVIEDPVTSSSGTTVFAMPYVRVEQGANRDEAQVSWPSSVRGSLRLTGRMDKPL